MQDSSHSAMDIEQILRQHWPLLVRLASSYRSDTLRRDDLLQEISIALWQALPRWRGEGSLRAYIARVAHNRAIDALAADRRPPTAALDEQHADPGPGPLQRAAVDEQRDGLLAAVRALPLGLRQVVSLALEGFSHREIAQTLGLEENAVAQRLSRARKQLRTLMGAPA